MGRRLRPLLATLAVVALAACEGPAQWRYEEALEQAPRAAAHAVYDEQLKRVMRDLGGLRGDLLPKAVDLEVEEDRRAAEVSRVARAMAASANQIQSSAATGDEAGLHELAEDLERLTAALARDVGNLTPDERAARLAEIDATCDRCHDRFRIPRDTRGED